MADAVREEICKAIESTETPVIYAARRLGLLRSSFQRMEAIEREAKNSRRNTNIKMNVRPSTDRIEDDLIIGLALCLDALAQDFEIETINVASDEIDAPIAKQLGKNIDLTKTRKSICSILKRRRGRRVSRAARTRSTMSHGSPTSRRQRNSPPHRDKRRDRKTRRQRSPDCCSATSRVDPAAMQEAQTLI